LRYLVDFDVAVSGSGHKQKAHDGQTLSAFGQSGHNERRCHANAGAVGVTRQPSGAHQPQTIATLFEAAIVAPTGSGATGAGPGERRDADL
jgi:hypothetical protein